MLNNKSGTENLEYKIKLWTVLKVSVCFSWNSYFKKSYFYHSYRNIPKRKRYFNYKYICLLIVLWRMSTSKSLSCLISARGNGQRLTRSYGIFHFSESGWICNLLRETTCGSWNFLTFHWHLDWSWGLKWTSSAQSNSQDLPNLLWFI